LLTIDSQRKSEVGERLQAEMKREGGRKSIEKCPSGKNSTNSSSGEGRRNISES
jgi:hypothetical protein